MSEDLVKAVQRYYALRGAEHDDWYARRGRFTDPNPQANATWHAQLAELSREITRFSASMPLVKDTTVLDLACGTGRWTSYFAKGLYSGATIVALDYARSMLDITLDHLAEEELADKVALIRADAYALPFANNVFDAVFMGLWLSHVPREKVYVFLKEVQRILKPKGQLLLFDSAPQAGQPNEEVQLRKLADGSQHRVLRVFYSPDELKTELETVFGAGNIRTSTTTRGLFVIGRVTL